MKRSCKVILPLLLFWSYSSSSAPSHDKNKRLVIIGYVAGYNGLVDTSKIDVAKLTHINYAFVDILNNRAWLHNEKTDTANFSRLNALKAKNQSLKILISIGGWSWSKNFSDAVLTDSSRKAFATSAVDLVRNYQLDGLDIDWEYPNMQGDGNIFRPQDKQNFTFMFQTLRQRLDSLQLQTGRRYLLTAAVGGFESFLENTEMGKVQTYLDYVNLMTYDYGWDKATHHTNLYISTDDGNSGDKAVMAFKKAGVPTQKLVMGIAFYGRGKTVNTITSNGLHQPSVASVYAGGYTYIKDSLINGKTYKRYWDKKAKAPYLFNKETKTFISYDDEQSVRHKCQYVKKNEMAGVMFWENSEDAKGYLLREIDQELTHN